MTAECTDDPDASEREFDALEDGDSESTAGRPGPERAIADPEAAPPDPEAAVVRIHERADAVRDRELETAIAQLEARGDLSAAEREAVERLADRLVSRLLAVPERSLREAAEADDEETVETALSLFG